jgi:GNAT superfamily N-acetyltransferase
MHSIRIADVNDIHIIQAIAEKTWWPTYSSILTEVQISYMLKAIYSTEPLLKAMTTNSQTFILLSDEHGAQGFASFGKRSGETNVFKLHKLYVLPENHGKGYGKILMDDVKKRITAEGSNTLDLNVNRYNKARTFYEKIGFQIIAEEDVPIGPYWMNDYVMRLIINK